MEIWKFRVSIDDVQEIEMSEGARLLSFDVQNDTPCVWALVAPDNPKVRRRFRLLCGTGHKIDGGDAQMYVGSCQQFSGALVWHLFDLGESK